MTATRFVVIAPPPVNRKEDGSVVLVPAYTRDIGNTYEDLRDAIGGYITIICVDERPGGFTCYGGDESILEAKPWNRFLHGHYVAGTMVFMGPPDRHGEDTSLTPAAAEKLLTMLNEMVPTIKDGRVIHGWLDGTPSSIEKLEEMTGYPAATYTPLGEDMKPNGPTVSLTEMPVPERP